jgi:hypothetical protein
MEDGWGNKSYGKEYKIVKASDGTYVRVPRRIKHGILEKNGDTWELLTTNGDGYDSEE